MESRRKLAAPFAPPLGAMDPAEDEPAGRVEASIMNADDDMEAALEEAFDAVVENDEAVTQGAFADIGLAVRAARGTLYIITTPLHCHIVANDSCK